MEDYDEGKSSEIEQRIKKLQGKLKSSQNVFNRKSIVEELSKLEQERLSSGNLFSDTDQSERAADSPTEEFPVLAQLREHYARLLSQVKAQEKDVQAVFLYTQYFDDEFLGMLTERKLKLDVKFSLEREVFYNLFSELARKRDDYLAEARRIHAGDYSKSYEEDILRRLVEMRHNLFIDSDRFFRRLGRFTDALVEDIDGEGILCQNAEERLEYDVIDREKVLPGRTVKEALGMLGELCDEVVDYLDIPDFQR